MYVAFQKEGCECGIEFVEESEEAARAGREGVDVGSDEEGYREEIGDL